LSEPSDPRGTADDAAQSRAGAVQAVRFLRVANVTVGIVLVVSFLWVTVGRFLHHGADHEWMTGAVRETVDRVRVGLPLYDAPSATFVPFLYPPVYYWLSAGVARVTGTFVACKLVSLGATLGTTAAVVAIARRLGATPFYAALAALLFLGAYGPTLTFYDLERVDVTAAAFVALGVLALVSKPTSRNMVAGGVLLALSCFTKQAGLGVLLAVLVALFVARRAKDALIVGGSALVVALVLGIYLERSTHGWFSYYCWTVPRRHGIDLSLVTLFPLRDIPSFAPMSAASLAIVTETGWGVAKRRSLPAPQLVFGAALAAGMVNAFLHRAHVGGYPNVLLAWTPLAAAAVGVGASRVAAAAQEKRSLVEGLVLGGILLGLMAFSFDPDTIAPGPSDDRYGERLRNLVARYEANGEVLVTPSGSISRKPHYHSAALFDILRAGAAAPPDLVDALTTRRFAAILASAPNDAPCAEQACAELHRLTMQRYFVAARIADPERSAMVGFDARPRWLLLPRTRVDDRLTPEDLERRERREIAIVVDRATDPANEGKEADVEAQAWPGLR